MACLFPRSLDFLFKVTRGLEILWERKRAKIAAIRIKRMEITKESMINYLQQMMDRVQGEIQKYGKDDRIVGKRIDDMIACKEMVEAFIQEPVNLGLDGVVSVG